MCGLKPTHAYMYAAGSLCGLHRVWKRNTVATSVVELYKLVCIIVHSIEDLYV